MANEIKYINPNKITFPMPPAWWTPVGIAIGTVIGLIICFFAGGN
jgi:hypothetical protein